MSTLTRKELIPYAEEWLNAWREAGCPTLNRNEIQDLMLIDFDYNYRIGNPGFKILEDSPSDEGHIRQFIFVNDTNVIPAMLAINCRVAAISETWLESHESTSVMERMGEMLDLLSITQIKAAQLCEDASALAQIAHPAAGKALAEIEARLLRRKIQTGSSTTQRRL